MGKRKVDLRFGWEYPKIEEQLNNQGLTLGEFTTMFERARECALFLATATLLSENDAMKLFNKLTSEISKKVKRYE